MVLAVPQENGLPADEKIKPLSAAQDRSIKAAYRYAVRLTRHSGSSFYLAFLTLPRPMYRAMCVIYAFMRLTDDIADAPLPRSNRSTAVTDPAVELQQRLKNLQHWREELQKATHDEKTTHLLFPALIEVVNRFRIDPQWLEDVIEGVKHDLEPVSFSQYADLQQYCYHVAGTVGLCCQAIWGADVSQTRADAIACGEAFQLTNILRDLHEDACNSRCYLPAEEMNRFQCTLDDFANQHTSSAYKDLMIFQIERANRCYQQAALLEKNLKGAGLKMFRKMFSTYYFLLKKIAASPEKALMQRTRLSRIEKAKILLTAGSCPVNNLLKK